MPTRRVDPVIDPDAQTGQHQTDSAFEELSEEATRAVIDLSRSSHRSLVAAVLAGSIYALWAYLVNDGHSIEAGASAAAVQGGYSFGSALATTLLLDWLRESLGHSRLASAATVFLAFAVFTSIGATLHWLAGTPEILVTLLPGMAIGTSYSAIYVFALNARARRRLRG